MSEATPSNDQLTVVLVHGAFADGSSWNGVIEHLQAAKIQVTAPANPLRGVISDSAYIASVFEQIPGPVLAVGHSYAGAVISNAAADADNVVGLVFVSAFATEEGEVLGEATATSKDAILGPALVPHKYPTGDGTQTATEFSVDAEKFQEVFAADVPQHKRRTWPQPKGRSRRCASRIGRARLRGSRCRHGRSSQPETRPPEPISPARWPSAPERRSPRLDGSHVIMVSQPEAVADVIMTAIAAVDRATVHA